MTKLTIDIRHFLFLFILLLFTACNQNSSTPEYGSATQELIDLVENDADLKRMLTASIKKAWEINPDPNTNPARTLNEYYDFITWAETTMPWALIKKDAYPEIFDHTFQGLMAFYFIIDQPLPELEGRGLINNSLQYAQPFAGWLNTFGTSWGQYLDTEESWNAAHYEMALNDPNFGLQNGWYEDPDNWKTFNDFFSRYLKSPGMRPIVEPEKEYVVASYADSEPQGKWAIDENSNLTDDDGIPVKSSTIRSVAELIGKDSKYAHAFANGTLTHSFLNVNDYHRYHFPMSGVVKEARIIEGINPTGGKIWWDAENKRYGFNPTAKTGWQAVETRGSVILDTEEFGLVALLPIGMGVVSSVNLEEGVVEGARFNKGDMLGHFAFGGSDFVMVFQEEVEFILDAPKDPVTDQYKHLLVGERMGYVVKRRP
jgi:phosphatidylserine decarboxylase